eukprot:gene7476-552_t
MAWHVAVGRRAIKLAVIAVVTIAFGISMFSVIIKMTGWRGIHVSMLKGLYTPDSKEFDSLEYLHLRCASESLDRDFRQLEVATALSAAAEVYKPSFVMTTGDIIYADGISSADDPQVIEKFFNPYASPSLQIPWHLTPGNHDCRGSIRAMINLHNTSTQWHMPSRNYVYEHHFSEGKAIRIIYVDTCLLVCGKPHTHGTVPNFRCDGPMKQNFDDDSFSEAIKWLNKELAQPAWWKFVVGHWSIFSVLGNGPTPQLFQELLPRLIENNVHAYFNGHDHGLQHIIYPRKATSKLNVIVSGGGGFELHPQLKAEASGDLNANIHVKFARAVHGFVRGSLTENVLRLSFMDISGNIIYEGEIWHPTHKKSGFSKIPTISQRRSVLP